MALLADAGSIAYTFTEISDPLQTSSTDLYGINDAGQIVG